MKFETDFEARIFVEHHDLLGDFDGLEKIDVFYILEDPFNPFSPIQFQKVINNETLDQIPIFRIAEELLKIIKRDKQIKMTANGFLPRKYVTEIYEKKYILEAFIEKGISTLSHEKNCLSILCARAVLQLSNLLIMTGEKLTLSESAIELLKDNDREQIFKIFFQAYTTKFAWHTLDGYPNVPIGQEGWPFNLILLNMYGNRKRNVQFYIDKYYKANPIDYSKLNEIYLRAKVDYFMCYTIRTIERFLLWFGFVEVEYNDHLYFKTVLKIKRTELIDKVFTFKYEE